jgi:threonine/homoserine/homoserine lactone efflux protein
MDPWIAFIGVSALVIMTPGQDTALTIRNTLSGGRRAGIATALGVAVGQLGWTIAATVGLTALLVASEPAFVAVRVAGGLYLVWLGLGSLRAAIRGTGGAESAPPARAPGLRARAAWRQGLLSSLGNPKLAVFFSTMFPAFVPGGVPPLAAMPALGLVFATMTVTWLAGSATLVDRLGDRLRAGRLRRAFDAAMGAVLVTLGGRLALERR